MSHASKNTCSIISLTNCNIFRLFISYYINLLKINLNLQIPIYNLFQILGVEKYASPDELKRAYHKLALKYHPDKNPKDPKAAKEAFQQIQQAYDIIQNYLNHANQSRHVHMFLEWIVYRMVRFCIYGS